MIDGGELLVRTLKKAGLTHIFTLHGVHIDPIFQACIDHRITMIDTRHEAAAGHAAEAYARSTGTTGVAVVTAGPGFTNVVTSVTNAWLDRVPVLYITGAPPLREAETNAFQGGFDQVAMMEPVTKFAHRVASAERMPGLVAHALRAANEGRPGPVFLEIPMDLMFGKIDAAGISIPEPCDRPRPAPPAAAIDAAIDMLAGARRPVIMAGGGVMHSGAGAELLALAETTGIPVFTNARSHGVIPGDHPLSGGWYVNLAGLGRAGNGGDVILLIGGRMGAFTGGLSDMVIPKDASLIHIDIDGRELGRNRRADIAIVADPREALAALAASAKTRDWPDHGPWQAMVRDTADAHESRFAEVVAGTEPPIHPYQAIRTVLDVLDDDAIIAADGAECFHWLEMMARIKQPGGFLSPGYLGCLGVGLPFAVGAKVAHPGRQVLCLVGDGSVGLNITEFNTMVRHDLAIVTVVINNQSWGASVHGQDAFYGRNRLAVSQLGEVSYHEVAAGFGCHGALVERIEDLKPALAEAFACGRPACINVMVDPWAVPPDVEALIGGMKAALF